MSILDWTPFRPKQPAAVDVEPPKQLASATATVGTDPKHKTILKRDRKEEPKGLEELAEMVEADYQFKLGFLALKALITSVGAVVEAPEDPASQLLAKNLQGFFDRSLKDCMQAFGRGRAAFEKTMKVERGLTVLAGLDYLPFSKTTMVLDDAGNFQGIELKGVGEKAVVLDPSESWWFALDPTVTEPHGRSRYLGAVWNVYQARKDLRANESIWYKRHAIGQGKARAPKAEGAEADLEENWPINRLANTVAAAESGGYYLLSSALYTDLAGAPIPGAYQYDVELSEGLRDASALIARGQQLDDAALRAEGIPERALTQNSDVGSESMAETHQILLYVTADDLLKQIVDSFQKYVIDKLCTYNWGRNPGIKIAYTTLLDQYKERQEKAATQQPAQQFGRPGGFSLASVAPPKEMKPWTVHAELASEVIQSKGRMIEDILSDPEQAAKILYSNGTERGKFQEALGDLRKDVSTAAIASALSGAVAPFAPRLITSPPGNPIEKPQAIQPPGE